MIIDGIWSHVGSTNLDDRSFDINEEAGVGIIDEDDREPSSRRRSRTT